MEDRWFAALDIGGTKVAIGLVKNQTIVVEQGAVPTSKEPDKILASVKEILEKQCERASICLKDLSGVGIVCAGPVDVEKGLVENPYTLPGWEEYAIVEKVSCLLGVPAYMENDANGALLGEVKQKGLEDKRVFMITIGTGIGGAFWDGNHVYRTGRKYHPELGHMIISSESAGECYCKHPGCMEKLLSGTALHARARQLGFGDFNEAVKAKHQDDPTAQEFIIKIQREFKSALWNFSLIFQPDVFILGGGMAGAYFDLFDQAGKELEKSDDFIYPFQLLLGEQEINPALLGAAALPDLAKEVRA